MTCAGVHDDTNQSHNTPKCKIFSRKLQYPWHPYFNKNVDIYIHFKRARIESYRCSAKGHPEQKRFDIPVWMFDSALCSEMKLLQKPYCHLEALKQLLILVRETSPVQCIINQTANTLNKSGETNVKFEPASKHNGDATIPATGPSSDDMERLAKTSTATSCQSDEHDHN